MIILVAGLQSIPRDYLEAADVFGATTWQKIRRVILPMLRPSLQVALILRTILAFQVFATVVALGGNRHHRARRARRYWANDIDNDHVAAAYAGLILLLSIAATVLFLGCFRPARSSTDDRRGRRSRSRRGGRRRPRVAASAGPLAVR